MSNQALMKRAARVIPRDDSFDSTLALLRDPYRYIGQLCNRYGSDVVQARFLLQPTILMRGRDAAELFYDAERFTRIRAAPEPLKKTLFGVGGIQGTEGAEHQNRKEMFLALATGQRAFELNQCFADWWSVYARRWQARPKVRLYEQLQELLCRTVCYWAGVPLPEGDVSRRTRQLAVLFDQSSLLSLKHLRSRWARKQANQWARRLIREFRAGGINVPETSPAYIIANHRGADGKLMSEHVAAVELINLLRPTVAVSVYIVFAALALHDYPQCRHQVISGNRDMLDAFEMELLTAVRQAIGNLEVQAPSIPPQSISSPSVPAHSPAPAEVNLRPLRILLAEDTAANQKLVTAILKKRGHSVGVVHNGREALDMLKHHEFDLVLMDVQMPIMDGLQATAAIRTLAKPSHSQIPIIAMTAHTMPGDKERCLAAGMDAYLSKPINSKELLDMLEFAMRIGENRARSGVPAPGPALSQV